MTTLQNLFNELCDKYAAAFCDKHNLWIRDAFWVGNEHGTVYIVGDYCVDFDSMRYDIDNNIPEKEWIEWYDYNLKWAELKLMNDETPKDHISFKNWCEGAPRKTEEEYQLALDKYKQIEKLKKELKELL